MEHDLPENILLKPSRPVGIVGYGAYVPRYRLPASEVARIWTAGQGGLPIKEKSVPGLERSATGGTDVERGFVADSCQQAYLIEHEPDGIERRGF